MSDSSKLDTVPEIARRVPQGAEGWDSAGASSSREVPDPSWPSARAYTRIVCPSLSELDPKLPEPIARRTPLGKAWRVLERTLEARIEEAAIAAGKKHDSSVKPSEAS